MTDWLEKSAEFYGITMDEAKERQHRCAEQGNNPKDPICVGCARRPPEIPAYRWAAMEHEDDIVTDADVTVYVIREDGTFNRKNGHFLCDECYIRNGQPSSERGWVCP